MNTRTVQRLKQLRKMEVPDLESWTEYRALTLTLLFEACESWSRVVSFLLEAREDFLAGMPVEFFADILHEAKQRKVTSGR